MFNVPLTYLFAEGHLSARRELPGNGLPVLDGILVTRIISFQ